MGSTLHCSKNNKKNFWDITRHLEENEILHKIFRIVSRFPRFRHHNSTYKDKPGNFSEIVNQRVLFALFYSQKMYAYCQG